LPGMSGLDLHHELNEVGGDIPVILVTGYGDVPTSVRAMKAGALDFLTKPYDVDDLLAGVRRAVWHRSPAHPPATRIEGIVGESQRLHAALCRGQGGARSCAH